MIAKKLRRMIPYGMGVGLLFIVWGIQVHGVQASIYGTGDYGSCTYDCAGTAPTVSTLPSGLQVAVNLTNGQTIPYSGYTIIVTPLNGQGTSFKQVAIYINGTLAATLTPDSTGTATWFWNPGQVPGTDVKIVVTGTDGSTVTQEYQVKIGGRPVVAQTTPQSSGGGLPQAVAQTVRQIYNTLKQTIRHLPRPIAYSFPYVLLILLGVNVLVLVLQLQHELHEFHTLQALLERSRDLTESKHDLVALVAHYLRTPMSVIRGGIDLISRGNVVSSDVVDLESITKRMHDKIEQLVQEMGSIVSVPSVEVGGLRKRYTWQRFRVFIPVGLIAIIIVPFDYLLAHAGTFTGHQVNFAAQAIIFASLVLASYQVFRRVTLHRQKTAATKKLLDQEEAINQARDSVISATVATLGQDLQGIDTVLGRLGDSPANRFLNRGRSDFHSVLAKFSIAEHLRGGSASGPFMPIRMSELVNQATQGLNEKIKQQGVTIRLAVDEEVPIQNAQLMVFVLNTVLDNAVAYSRQGGEIGVTLLHVDGGPAIEVTDHGEGIPSEKQPLLFQAFSKGEGSETFTHAGMGFSLYLDKLIMTYLGGSIVVNSQPSRGTQVILHLPSPRQLYSEEGESRGSHAGLIQPAGVH